MPRPQSTPNPQRDTPERRTIVKDHPDAPTEKPWSLMQGSRLLASYASEDEVREHDKRIRENESRDVTALREGLPERERRFMELPTSVELRETDRGPQIAMWIPFNSRSAAMWGFHEIIRPGAFTKTVREADIVSLWNHDPLWVLGRRSNKTLTVGLSEDGAEATVQLDGDDSMHQYFARRVERRDVTGTSFGFSVVKEKWGVDEENDNTPLRELLEVKLFDISPVTFPAYPESDAEARSLVDVVTLKAGQPFDELAEALTELQDGKVPPERREILQTWIARLQEYLPATPTDPILAVRRRKLDLIAREVGIAA